MPTRPAFASLLFACGLVALPGRAADGPPPKMTDPFPHPKGYVCHRAAGPITVDGKPAEAVWAAVPTQGRPSLGFQPELHFAFGSRTS